MSSKQQIWLVRHGETEWSRLGRHTGRTDKRLLPEGEAQARALQPILAQHTFQAVFASPLQRARETCRLAGLGDAVQLEDDLYEWNYGAYEGRTSAEIRVDVPNWSVWTHPIPGGESLDDVAARTRRVIERATRVPGDVALFAHGHVLRILAATWLGMLPSAGRNFALETGSISVLGYEHEWRVIRRWSATPDDACRARAGTSERPR